MKDEHKIRHEELEEQKKRLERAGEGVRAGSAEES